MSDVFISHSSKDAAIANKICGILEKNGISCWLAPRNIMPGDDWATAIAKAITTTKVFIIIYSANSAASTQVPKEIMLAGSKSSYIIPYKIDDTPLKENFEYHLGASHWISADIAHRNYKDEELIAAVRAGIGRDGGVTINNVTNVAGNVNNYSAPAPSAGGNKTRNIIIAAAAALAVIGIIITAVVIASSGGDEKPDDTDSPSVSQTDNSGDSVGAGAIEDEEKVVLPVNAVSAPVGYTFYDWYGNEPVVYSGGNDKLTIRNEVRNEGYLLKENDSYLMFNTEDFSGVSFTADVMEQSDKTVTMHVYTDGSEYNTYTLSSAAGAVHVEIDLSEISMLVIGTEDGYALPSTALYDFIFIKDENAGEEAAEETPDNVVVVPDEYGIYDWYGNEIGIFEGRNDSFTIMGNTYNSGYTLNHDGSSLMFDVSRFSEVTLMAGALDSGTSNENEIHIYLDNVEENAIPVSGKRPPEKITIDVSGASIMRLETEGEYGAPTLGLYDIRFTESDNPPAEKAPYEAPEGFELVNVPQDYSFYNTDGKKITVYNGKNESFNVLGKTYNSGYVLNSDGSELLFNVSDFTEVFFTAGALDSGTANEDTLRIYLDNQEDMAYTINGKSLPEEIRVDVSNATIMRITTDGGYAKPNTALFNIGFVRSTEAAPEEEEPVVPEDCEIVVAPDQYSYYNHYKNEPEIYDGKNETFSVLGNTYNSGYVFSTGGTCMLFNVEDFTEISFTLGAEDAGNVNDLEIPVYLDNEEYMTLTVTGKGIPETHTIDVTNASVLKIGHDGPYAAPRIAMYGIKFVKPAVSPVPDEVIDNTGYVTLPADASGETAEGDIGIYNGKTDTFRIMGETFNSGYVMGSGGGSITFDVSAYSEISFWAAALDTGNDSTTDLKIYIDDAEYDYIRISTDKIPDSLTIDLANASTLKIVHEGNYGAPDAAIYHVRLR